MFIEVREGDWTFFMHRGHTGGSLEAHKKDCLTMPSVKSDVIRAL